MTLQEAIDALPDTADGIAEFLKDKGVKGRCESAFKCALAKYFLTATEADWVRVDGEMVGIWRNLKVERQKLPSPATVFIEHFDASRYPDLIAEPAHA